MIKNSSTKSLKNNAFLSVVKQLFSIIFPIITFPYILRVLGVENYGKYTFSVSVVNYISYIAAAGILRYAIRECARVRDDRAKFRKIVNEIFTINVFTTVVAFFILFLLLSTVPIMRGYTAYIMIISLSVLFTTIGIDWINNAQEDYFFITIRYIVTQFISVILLFIFVKESSDLIEYSLISVLGGVLANILNIIHIKKTIGYYPKIVVSKAIIGHFRPILYLFASTIATVIYINSDISILRIFSDDKSIAYYGVSTQFYQLLKQLVNAAFVVAIPRLSNEIVKDKLNATKRYEDILNLVILIIVPSAIGLFMIKENIILLFAGEDYLQATSSLAILSFSLIPAMLANYFINIVMIPLRLERQVMIATVSSALINIGLNFLFIPIYAEEAAAFTTFLAEISMVIIAIYFCKSLSLVKPNRAIIYSFIGSVGIFFTCSFVNKIINYPILNILLCVCLSALIYAAVIGTGFRKQIISIFKG